MTYDNKQELLNLSTNKFKRIEGALSASQSKYNNWHKFYAVKRLASLVKSGIKWFENCKMGVPLNTACPPSISLSIAMSSLISIP